MAYSTPHEPASFHAEHVTPVATLLKAYAALITLMVITIATALAPHYVASEFFNSQIGSVFNNLVAMTIAVVKALIVLLIFMGLRNGSKTVRLYAVMGFVWFLLMFIVFADYGTRQWEPVRGWEPIAPGSMPRQRGSSEPDIERTPAPPPLSTIPGP